MGVRLRLELTYLGILYIVCYWCVIPSQTYQVQR